MPTQGPLQSPYHSSAQVYKIWWLSMHLARVQLLQGTLFQLTNAIGSDLAGGP